MTRPFKASSEQEVGDARVRHDRGPGHVPDAVHVELGDLAMRGASILAATGHREVSVLASGPDDWSAATGVELEIA